MIGAEALVAPGQDQHTDVRILADPGDGLAQYGQIVGLDPIALARAVEADRGAALRDRDDRRGRIARCV
jgi:hypothetical protein